MNNIQILTAPLTKQARGEFAEQTVLQILEGEINPLDAEIMLKSMEETIALIRKDARIKEAVSSELLKHGGKSVPYKGVTFGITQKRTYTYNECNDTYYNDLTFKMEELKGLIKAREEFLKTIKDNMNIADAETGLILNPPSFTTIEVITMKFK